MPRGYKHAVGSKSSWNHLLTHIFVIFALMIKPHHQGCQEVTICSSLILRDSKDLQSRWCCDCRPSKLLCGGGCPLKPWDVYYMFPVACWSLFGFPISLVFHFLNEARILLGFYMIRICPSASGECVVNDLAAIRQWLVNHWVWDFLLIFFWRKVSQYRSWLGSLISYIPEWEGMNNYDHFFPPGNRWPSWTQWPPSIPACRHSWSSYFYVWLFSSPALLVSTLIIGNKHFLGTYSAFSIFTVSEYLIMHMNLFSVLI